MSDGKPSVLLLGSYHMANRGLDRFNLGADDLRTDRRQQEIGQVVDRLLHFQPRKVAVEVLPSCGDTLNAEYEAYRTGRFDLPRDEVYQLGFRVAERSGHSHLHPINAMVSRDVDPFQWANEHGQLDRVEQMTHSWQALVNEEKACLAQRSVQEVLRRLNAPDRGKQEQALYLQQARIGAGDQYPGVEWLAGWYERNLKIFANLTRIAEPDDPIFVLCGSGHVPLLRQFIGDSGIYHLQNVEPYLA